MPAVRLKAPLASRGGARSITFYCRPWPCRKQTGTSRQDRLSPAASCPARNERAPIKRGLKIPVRSYTRLGEIRNDEGCRGKGGRGSLGKSFRDTPPVATHVSSAHQPVHHRRDDGAARGVVPASLRRGVGVVSAAAAAAVGGRGHHSRHVHTPRSGAVAPRQPLQPTKSKGAAKRR